MPSVWIRRASSDDILSQLEFIITLKGRHSGDIVIKSGACDLTHSQKAALSAALKKSQPVRLSKLGGDVNRNRSPLYSLEIRGTEKSSQTV